MLASCSPDKSWGLLTPVSHGRCFSNLTGRGAGRKQKGPREEAPLTWGQAPNGSEAGTGCCPGNESCPHWSLGAAPRADTHQAAPGSRGSQEEAASGRSPASSGTGDREPARTHRPPGRLRPCWLVKSLGSQAKAGCHRARAPGTRSCRRPHFLWPRHPPRTQAAEPSQPASRTDRARESSLSRSPPPHQYIERPEEHLLFLPTALKNPGHHALDLGALVSVTDAPRTAGIPPQLPCPFLLLLPLEHRWS